VLYRESTRVNRPTRPCDIVEGNTLRELTDAEMDNPIRPRDLADLPLKELLFRVLKGGVSTDTPLKRSRHPLDGGFTQVALPHRRTRLVQLFHRQHDADPP